MKTTNRTRHFAFMGAALALLLGSSAAQAVMITAWDWYNEAGFSAYTPGTVTATGISGSALSEATTLSWGSGADGPSQLISDGNATSTLGTRIITNSLTPMTSGVILTHQNRPITGDTLATAVLNDYFELTPAVPSGSSLAPETLNLNIAFEETPNGATPCADGGTNGVGVNINGCADIFVVTNPGALVKTFDIDDYRYTLTIGALGLGPLSDDACSAAGQGSGCVGFETIEDATNVLTPAVFISARQIPVPEPTSLALLGLGLVGISFARKRN